MNNSVSTVYIAFTLYSTLGVYKFALVIFVCLFYISGLCINLFLVVVICMKSRLHRPMYVLLAHLALSGVMGSSSVCPNMIKHLLLDSQESSLRECLTQVFFTNMYGGCIFCILALMAYDRYVSICKPLLYHLIMTPHKVRLMLMMLYLILSCSSAVQVYLTSTLRLCRHTVDKLICDSLVIANLSCKQTTLISTYGLCCAFGVIITPCCLVILSYVHIFSVIVRNSKESQRKALQTCTPHLLTFINFCVASFFGVIYNRQRHEVPNAIKIFICINFFVLPPLIHPIIYGIKMQEIQQNIKKVIMSIKHSC